MGSISQFGGLYGCWACRRRWRRREGLADDEGEFAGRAGRLNLVDELLASRPHQKVRLNARLLRLQDDDVVPKLHLHALSADYCSRDNIWELDHRCVVEGGCEFLDDMLIHNVRLDFRLSASPRGMSCRRYNRERHPKNPFQHRSEEH